MESRDDELKRIWIYRNGNGALRVYPSPIWLRPKDRFEIRDLTGQLREITWPGAAIVWCQKEEPDPRSKSSDEKRTDPPIGWYDEKNLVAQVDEKTVSGYYEYQVFLTSGQYAEGTSRPGVIVD